MIKMLFFVNLCFASVFALPSLVKFNKSTLVVIGGEIGIDFPFENVKYLSTGEYRSIGAEPLTGALFQLGISMPLLADKNTHLEFNLIFPRSISETDWSEKYPIYDDGELHATYLTEKNTISGIGVNSRLFKYLQHGRQTFFLSAGLALVSFNRSRNITTTAPNNIYNSMYTPDGSTESAFNFGFDGGTGVLLRISSTKYLRIGYRGGLSLLPEQSFNGALIPYSSMGYLITHHLTANLLLRL
jgi:hypothetical protein